MCLLAGRLVKNVLLFRQKFCQFFIFVYYAFVGLLYPLPVICSVVLVVSAYGVFIRKFLSNGTFLMAVRSLIMQEIPY